MHASMFFAFLLVVFIVGATATPIEITTYQRIYNYSDPSIIAIGSPMVNCSQELILLRNSTLTINVTSADTMKLLSSYNPVSFTGSTTAVNGTITAINSISCVGKYCFSFYARTVIALQYDNRQVRRSFGGTLIQQPQMLAAIQINATFFQVFVVDGRYNSTIYKFTWVDTGVINAGAATGSVVTQLNNSVPVVGLYQTSTTNIGILFQGSSYIQQYDVNGVYVQNASANIFSVGALLARDYYNRSFVYDLSCSCIKVIRSGVWIKTLPANSFTNAISITFSRNNIYVLDQYGIVKYSEDMSFNSFSVNDITCAASGALVQVSANDGALPLTYHQFFVDKNIVTTSSPNISMNVFKRSNDVAPYYIYTDSIYPAFSNAYNASFGVGVNIPKSSTVTYGGSSYSYAMKMVDNAIYGFSSSQVIDSGLYSAIEMMINIGNGGQNFSIYVDSILLKTVSPGDLPLNNWTMVSVDLSALTGHFYSSLLFTNGMFINPANPNNTIFVDDVVMVPYNNSVTRRQIFITDFCGVTVQAPYFDVQENGVMNLEIESTPTSCNAAGIDGTKAFDGMLLANITGGQSPYSYNWSIDGSTTSEVTGLGQIGANIYVFQNSLNSAFKASTNGDSNLADTTYFRSAPYSFSLSASNNLDSITFSFPSVVNASDYSAFQFYVYGGPVGQQLITARVVRSLNLLGDETYVHQLLGLPTIPPNKWMQVSLPILPSFDTFNGISFLAQGDWVQPTIYFDDLMLLSNTYTVTVQDSGGCTIFSPFLSVASPQLISATPIITNLKCYGSNNGAISLNVTGGNGPYFSSWSISSVAVSSLNVSSLAESIVKADVYDSNGCVSPASTISYVLQPPPLGIDYSVSSLKCYGQFAIMNATAAGGKGPYTYSWSSPANSTYFVASTASPVSTFEDSFSLGFGLMGNLNQTVICQGTGSFLGNIGYVPSHSGYCSLAAYPYPENRTVFSIGCSQCIDTTMYSGMQLYINLEDMNDAENLKIGLFTYGASTSTLAPLFNLSGANISSPGWKKVIVDFSSATQEVADTINIRSSVAYTGRILVDDVVLLPKSTYIAASSSQAVGVGYNSMIYSAAGEYQLSVADSNGCPAVVSFSIPQPLQIAATASVAKTSNGKSNGKIEVSVSGGSPPYFIYSWPHDDKLTSPSADKLAEGSYIITVTDSNGCATNFTYQILAKPKSMTGAIAGGSVGGAIAVLGLAAFVVVYAYRQRRRTVQLLIDVEEGERRAYKIDFTALELKSVIGAGSFGEVCGGEYKGADVAVKKLKTQQMTKQQIDEFAKEAAIMVGLRHPNILLFMGVCVEPSKLCIVTELMPRGNLSEVLRDPNVAIPAQLIFKMALDAIKGIQFIHSSGLIHRDLKSPNLLVDKYWNIKIADFGLSCARHVANDEAQISLLWTAPEILNRTPNCYTFSSDIYSFGIILWELMTKELPWNGVAPAAITAKVASGHRPPVDNNWDPVTTRLITSAWAQDPSSRPTARETRSVIEGQIIPIVGEMQLGSSSTYSFQKKTQDFPVAVPPPVPPFAIVTSNFANSPKLWEEDPRAMSKAIESFIKLSQNMANQLGGFEISSGTPFVVAFASPISALNYSLRIQLAARDYAWDSSLLLCTCAREEMIDDVIVKRGPRIRMGIYWGAPATNKDDNGNTFFVGSALNVAYEMLSHTQGGTILIDQEMYNRLMSTSTTLEIDPFAINPIGPKTLNDGKQLSLYKLVPAVLKELLSETFIPPTADSEKEPWLITKDEFSFGSVIGSGSFGDVHSGTWNNKKVAIKKFIRQKITQQVLLEIQTECAILRGLHHPNIVKFEAMCLQQPNLCLLTELLERGSVGEILLSNADLPWSKRISFAKDIAEGLAYLHKNEIIHRDVKSSNLLVGSNWKVKIADFGFSRIKSANQTMTQCGTVAWTAPEIFSGNHYTEKADVFSYAVVLWELINRKKPWTGKHSMKVISMVESGGRLPLAGNPSDTPEGLVTLMLSCWEQNPDNRPGFSSILSSLSSL